MSRSNSDLAIAGGVVASVGICAFVALSIILGRQFAIPAVITGGVVLGLTLRGSLGRAIAERIRAPAVEPAEVPPEVLEEMDGLRTRLLELEERVDFTERLLARQRTEEPARLPPG